MKKLIVMTFLVSLLISLGGCKKRKEIIRKLPPGVGELVDQGKLKPVLKIPDKPPIELHNINFIIVTEKNIEEVFSKLKEDEKIPVLFSLDGKDYKLISLNVRILLDYIKYQKVVIGIYKDYYEKEKSVDKK